MISLIGQVYNVETSTFTRNGEERQVTRFRLGMPKPFKVEREIDGETREVRESTFLTCKVFNGLAGVIAKYFGGNENKGRWIQVSGYFDEVQYDRTMEVSKEDDPSVSFDIQVPVRELQFVVTNFQFIGSAPAAPATESQQQQQKSKPAFVARPKSRTQSSDQVTAKEIELELTEEELPF